MQAYSKILELLVEAGLPEPENIWLCSTCRGDLKDGKMPSLCVANNMQLVEIPEELGQLNFAELRQITQVRSNVPCIVCQQTCVVV